MLLRARYAPLVVGHAQRDAYVKALDQANDGDLRELVRLFARLEEFALRSELALPAEPTAEGSGALAVARAHAHRLRARQLAELNERTTKAQVLAGRLHEKVFAYLGELGVEIRDQFREVDPHAHRSMAQATPPEETASGTYSRFWDVASHLSEPNGACTAAAQAHQPNHRTAAVSATME